jgi:hypothetical protein
MTVSPDIPYIGYFTAKNEEMRNKFYVENPKAKKPILEGPVWKSWLANTQPQRKLPTLLLYRGTSRASFDRVAITPKDIVLTTRREKGSSETLEELRDSIMAWMKSFDALMPFVVQTDIEPDRWELDDMSLIASYAEPIEEFDMRRFPCMQSIFGYEDGTFRLLRAEHSSGSVSALELRAYQTLKESDEAPSATVLQQELGIPLKDAEALYAKFLELQVDEDFDVGKATKGYPVFRFFNKDVAVTFATTPDRMLKYADILRYVLTSDSEALNDVCPRRMESVEPISTQAPKTKIAIEEGDLDDDLMAALADLGEGIEEPEEEAETEAPAKKTKSVKVAAQTEKIHNYFTDRLRAFDPETFNSEYPGKCDAPKQVIVMTPQQELDAKVKFPEYAFEENPSERLPLDKGGVAICPAFWCLKDEIPLTLEQVTPPLPETDLRCPVCKGLLRTKKDDSQATHTLIKRNQTTPFPKYMKASNVPCCYKVSRKGVVVAPKTESSDPFYVLSTVAVPALRLAYIPDEVASQLAIKTDYPNSINEKRLKSGGTGIFRIGIGRPSATLPKLLDDEKAIPRPGDEVAKERLMQCSFFRTWTDMGEGDTPIDRIISGIDKAYEKKTLDVLNELEYVALIMGCRVLRVNTTTNTMSCGFWTDTYKATSRTIVMIDNDVLGQVKRMKNAKGPKYVVDLQKFDKQPKTLLERLNARACASDIPTFDDAIAELLKQGKTQYQVIHDPFGRVQALFVPNQVLLPIAPLGKEVSKAVRVRAGYAEIKAELPPREALGLFLKATIHAGFKVEEVMYDSEGNKAEFLLTSGFRTPFVPEPSEEPHPATEVVETIMEKGEDMLVKGESNKEDIAVAREISYSAEMFEFMLFTLSKDVQDDETLRNQIAEPERGALHKQISEWVKSRAYWDAVSEPATFVNKVRTPCGQFTKQDTCAKASLCGWKENTCKIRVKPIADKQKLIRRIVETIYNNEKQRALVLDGRLSPFFSTMLYLEMPHEWITIRAVGPNGAWLDDA